MGRTYIFLGTATLLLYYYISRLFILPLCLLLDINNCLALFDTLLQIVIYLIMIWILTAEFSVSYKLLIQNDINVMKVTITTVYQSITIDTK